MSFLREIGDALSRWQSGQQIRTALAQYEERIGGGTDRVQSFSDSGSFRSQVERLFGLATPYDVQELEAIAQAVVGSCLTNRYYRPADYLADVCEALESLTFLGPDRDGEAGLRELDREGRRQKLLRVKQAWLVPLKIAALESVVATYAKHLARALPYAALNRYEREAARLFALLEASEASTAERALNAFVEAWARSGELKQRFREPAAALAVVVRVLEGDLEGGESGGLRVRAPRQPLRMSTVVPEDRAALLAVALARLGTPAGPAPAAPAPARSAKTALAARPAAKQAPARPLADPSATDGPLLLLLSCPKCGGSFTADDETVTVSCEYCDSLLILSASEREEIYIDDDRFTGPQDVLDTVIEYRVQAYRAEVVTRYRAAHGPEETPSEAWVQAQLQAHERRLRAASVLLEAHRVFVPYWHVAGTLVQAVLGRLEQGSKVIRVRAFAVEHTSPGYDGVRHDLRDRGLRLAHARVRPLTAEQVRAAGAFLPIVPMPEASSREIERWRGQTLEPRFEAVARRSELLGARRMVAYRGYVLALVEVDRGREWVLADCAFRTIAGYPGEEEVRRLLGACIADPLRTGEESYRRVHIIASRCPDCGQEQDFDRRANVAFCASCRLALQPSPDGIQVVPYDHALVDGQPPEGDYLPFWRFPFALEIAGAAPVRDLEALAAAVFPNGAPPSFLRFGNGLWVPAVRLLGTLQGDEAFKRLGEWMHARRVETAGGKVPLGLRARLWGASLSASEAASLAPFALAGVHSSASAAQLNAPLFNRSLAQARLSLGAPRLVAVPFAREGQELALCGAPARLPELLLRGGPELEAQRASVHRLQR